MKTILAIMQNQWLARPEDHEAALADVAKRRGSEGREKFRRRFIHRALFSGCISGRVLKKHLGAMCDSIIWEEASRVVTATPRECPPADHGHIFATMESLRPDIVITFGKVAGNAVDAILAPGFSYRRKFIDRELSFIQSPHPAARGPAMQESVREACVALIEEARRQRELPL